MFEFVPVSDEAVCIPLYDCVHGLWVLARVSGLLGEVCLGMCFGVFGGLWAGGGLCCVGSVRSVSVEECSMSVCSSVSVS